MGGSIRTAITFRFSFVGVSMVLIAKIAIPLLLLCISCGPAPAQCGEDNDPDWYGRSATMINEPPPEDIYTRGRGQAFLGIPYAMPSNGSNAFKVPQDIDYRVDYTHQVNLDFGPYCPQMVEVAGMPGRNFFVGQQDCLTLNVLHPVPPNATRKYPVYVVLHPGWLLRGSARDFGVQGIVHNLVARGIVVVTVEYRLGVYGLFNFGTGAKGDSLRALYDVIAALEWVHEHIHNFAGNASAVTLGGWGDGGACLASWLIAAVTNKTNDLSHLFQQVSLHGGNAELCWLHFNSNAGREVANSSQTTTVDLCRTSSANRKFCLEKFCVCKAGDSKEVCEQKTHRCTQAAWSTAQKLALPLAQMEEPDGHLFRYPPAFAAFESFYVKERNTIRILMGWTRDEWAAIHAATPAELYDETFLRSEFFRLGHLTPNSTNNVTGAFEAVLNYYLSLYRLRKPLSEPEWYRLYIRFMSDFLIRVVNCDDAFLWAFAKNTVLFYQFDAVSGVPFTPQSFYDKAVGHLADMPYVFMAEQYFKPGEHNIAGAQDKQPLLAEWHLADVMGRFVADFVWQRPSTDYFHPLTQCEDPAIVYVPWVTHISREEGFAAPVVTSLPLDLFRVWSDVTHEFFWEGQEIYPDNSASHFTELPDCPHVDASNVSVGP